MASPEEERRQSVKALVHRQLGELIDLRRTSLEQLDGPRLRLRVESLIRQFLAGMAPPAPDLDNEEFLTEVMDEALGLGPLERFLRDPSVTEIMVNGPDAIYVERDGKIKASGHRFTGAASLRGAIDRIVSPLGRRVDEASPMADARLPDGSRVNVIIPPLVLNGATVTIRKFSKIPLSVAKLIELGSVTRQVVEFLKESVQARKNILIAGGTGSGKTTLLNALSGFIPPDERVLTIEDAAELRLEQTHVVSLEARPANVEGKGEITIRDLVRNALRMRPDRIVVGECRGGEALDMLQAMNTGHDGSMTTVHANSPRDALLRLETMVLMAGFDLPLRAVREQMAGALDLILYQARLGNGQRCVTHVTEVCGTEEGVIATQDLFVRHPGKGTIEFQGRMPRFLDSSSQDQRRSFLAALGGRTQLGAH
ncbi:MAG: CpaF family protein [Pseudomonadota bacterium]